MWYRLLADSIVIIHSAFVVFVVLGGFLTVRWRRVMWFHVPAAVYAGFIEFTGGICPLTPLENWLRIEGGMTGYPGGFVEYYLLPLLYPARLTREIQIALGVFVIVCNIWIYWYVLKKRGRKRPNECMRSGGF